MPCYHPMSAWQKTDGTIIIHGDIRDANRKRSPKSLIAKGINPLTDKKIVIPCGQCIGCRLEYSRQWADRCYLESKMHEHNYWLTLTYDEDHIKDLLKASIKRDTGEIINAPMLRKKDLTGFIKRLREHWQRKYNITGLKFYGCGEYGTQNHRPHYHISIFGLDIPDIQLWFTKDGFPTFRSAEIENIWGKGRLTINRNTWQTSAYTARYMLKKLKGREAKEQYEKAGVTPEFTICSRNPGIGKSYYDTHKEEIYAKDEIAYLKAKGGAQTRKPPKYFDRLYKAENPEGYAAHQKRREAIAKRKTKYRLIGQTQLPEFEQLKIDEQAKLETIRALARKLE